ncbi:hypothetical protein RhiirA1_448596 [Rhizophagus irregularis]|uniref:MYND-type domain-containing protein n=1 Tax=Rhizophagus irregularis TaxID=588596 RepID=A0A2N0SJG2_9GLOM|nr:hypothetical protein RhiirA1_448596 [Rhizophagus irregularis]
MICWNNATREKRPITPKLKRELFIKGFEIASKVPEDSDDETLKAHGQQILEATKYLVEAFLIDDNATEMSPRIMSLAQQYEKLIKLSYEGTESEKNAIELEINDAKLSEVIKAKKDHSAQDDQNDPDHLTRESLILVIWLLFNGKQYPFCIQTLTIALSQLEPKLHPRLYHLRALCYLTTEDVKNCIKDLERLLLLDPNFVDAYCIQGFVFMSQGERLDRLEAARNFKTYIEKASKDSASYSHALYALAALTCQNATSLTTGNRNQVTQNLRYQQAYNYYQKAKEAEERYEFLYGHTPDMIDAKRIAFIPEISDVKRNAMALFEQKSGKETTKVEKDSKKEAEKLAILQKFLTSHPNGEQQQSEKKCHSCGSQTRKDLNEKLDAEKKYKLLICAGCSNVNYCSKECQKKDWKNGHKQTCATAKTG